MESLELIKSRIQSITGTRQITQSMRLVSTSKVQKARALVEANRPFLLETERLARVAAENVPDARRHPYLCQGNQTKAAVIVVGGDRGLCGGYNTNVNRRAAALIKSLGGDVRIVAIGIKTREFCRRRYKEALARSFTGVSEALFYEEAEEIADLVRGWYDRGEVGRIYIVYTKFESMLALAPTDRLLLPLESEPPAGGVRQYVRCEPGGDVFLTRAVPFYLTACLFGAMTESAYCEQSARVVSMDSAVKNADEMIRALTLLYNQARQGAITQEIIEIVSGADAGRGKQ